MLPFNLRIGRGANKDDGDDRGLAVKSLFGPRPRAASSDSFNSGSRADDTKLLSSGDGVAFDPSDKDGFVLQRTSKIDKQMDAFKDAFKEKTGLFDLKDLDDSLCGLYDKDHWRAEDEAAAAAAAEGNSGGESSGAKSDNNADKNADLLGLWEIDENHATGNGDDTPPAASGNVAASAPVGGGGDSGSDRTSGAGSDSGKKAKPQLPTAGSSPPNMRLSMGPASNNRATLEELSRRDFDADESEPNSPVRGGTEVGGRTEMGSTVSGGGGFIAAATDQPVAAAAAAGGSGDGGEEVGSSSQRSSKPRQLLFSVIKLRSEAEIMSSLDPRLFDGAFDPVLAIIDELPDELSEHDEHVEVELRDKDMAKDAVIKQLSIKVTRNYSMLVEGMKQVQLVDLDLARTGVHMAHARRRLASATGSSTAFLQVLRLQKRRERLHEVHAIAKEMKEVVRQEEAINDAIKMGRFPEAIVSAAELEQALGTGPLANIWLLRGVRARARAVLPRMRDALQSALFGLCMGFSAVEYSRTVKAYLLLEERGVLVEGGKDGKGARGGTKTAPLVEEGADQATAAAAVAAAGEAALKERAVSLAEGDETSATDSDADSGFAGAGGGSDDDTEDGEARGAKEERADTEDSPLPLPHDCHGTPPPSSPHDVANGGGVSSPHGGGGGGGFGADKAALMAQKKFGLAMMGSQVQRCFLDEIDRQVREAVVAGIMEEHTANGGSSATNPGGETACQHGEGGAAVPEVAPTPAEQLFGRAAAEHSLSSFGSSGRLSPPLPPTPTNARSPTPLPPTPTSAAATGSSGAWPAADAAIASSIGGVAAVAVAAVRLPRLLSTIGGGVGGIGTFARARLSMDPEDLQRHKLAELIDELPPTQLLPAVLRVCRGAAELMHSHFLMTQWHLSPFDERNEDDDFLYRCPISHGPTGHAAGTVSPPGPATTSAAAATSKSGGSHGAFGSRAARQKASMRHGGPAAAAVAAVDPNLRAQLSVLEESLRSQRSAIWARIERSLERLLAAAPARDGVMGLEGLASLLGMLHIFVALGEEFSGRESPVLRRRLAEKAEQFFDSKHAEALQVLRQMVERELWQRVPVSLLEMGGLEGLLKATSRRFAVADSAVLRGVSPAWADVAGAVAAASAAAAAAPPASGASASVIAAVPAAASVSDNRDSGGAPSSILVAWGTRGNPFAIRWRDAEAPENGDTGKAKSPTGANAAAAAAAAEDGEAAAAAQLAEEAVPPEEGVADVERYGTRWVVTQASLNGLGRYMGYYLEVMALLKPAAAATAAWDRLCLLVDEYLYAIFSLFVPPKALAGLWAEPDEAGALLPCDRDALMPLRSFLERVMRQRGITPDAVVRAAGGRDRRTRLGFPRGGAIPAPPGSSNSLSPDTRAGSSSGPRSVSPPVPSWPSAGSSHANSGGGSGDGHEALDAAHAAASAAASAAAAAASAAATAAANAAASGRAWLGGSEAETTAAAALRAGSGEPRSGSGGSAAVTAAATAAAGAAAAGRGGSSLRSSGGGAVAVAAAAAVVPLAAANGSGTVPGSPPRRIPLPASVDPEQGSGEANLFGLGERAVAAESCLFAARLLRAVYERVASRRLLPPHVLERCDEYVRAVAAAAPKLRLLVYRGVAPLLIGADRLALAVGSQRWQLSQIQNDVSAYVEGVCERCETLRAAVMGGGGEGRGGGGVAALAVPLPPAAQRRAWAEALQAVLEALVDGFSRAKSCSTEGRALMSMDLQAICGTLERPLGRPLLAPERGRGYALAYVNAFYYGQADLVAWVEQNWRRYRPAHMAALLLVEQGGGSGGISVAAAAAAAAARAKAARKPPRELVARMEALYRGEVSDMGMPRPASPRKGTTSPPLGGAFGSTFGARSPPVIAGAANSSAVANKSAAPVLLASAGPAGAARKSSAPSLLATPETLAPSIVPALKPLEASGLSMLPPPDMLLPTQSSPPPPPPMPLEWPPQQSKEDPESVVLPQLATQPPTPHQAAAPPPPPPPQQLPQPPQPPPLAAAGAADLQRTKASPPKLLFPRRGSARGLFGGGIGGGFGGGIGGTSAMAGEDTAGGDSTSFGDSLSSVGASMSAAMSLSPLRRMGAPAFFQGSGKAGDASSSGGDGGGGNGGNGSKDKLGAAAASGGTSVPGGAGARRLAGFRPFGAGKGSGSGGGGGGAEQHDATPAASADEK